MLNCIKLIPPKFWYKKSIISYLLLPFSFIFIIVISLRRFYYQVLAQKFKTQEIIPVPVIIIGNITVGGTGKTPLVIHLVEFFKSRGYKPGVISRGYGGESKKYSLLVTSKSKVKEVGDEALLISRRTQCPVVVGPKKVESAKMLYSNNNCNIIISDDGLQHYALQRNIEIAVVDKDDDFGNKFCLPAGPLREPLRRLKQVDFVVNNNSEYNMFLEPVIFYNIKNQACTKAIDEFKNQTVHAVAGIGKPEKFFQTLSKLGIKVIEHQFPDHYLFKAADFLFIKNSRSEIVIMTEKDAIKCDTIIDSDNCWCLKIIVRLSGEFEDKLENKLEAFT